MADPYDDDDLEDLEDDDEFDDEEEDEEDFEEEDEEAEYEEPLPPKVTLLTMALCVLNILAACGFAFLLTLDYQARQRWSRAVFLFDVAIYGLPLAEEEQESAAQVSRRNVNVSSQTIKEHFRRRGTGVSVKEPFRDVNEMLKTRVKPSRLTTPILKDVFKRVAGQPVKTLDEEVQRVHRQFFTDVDNATTIFAKTLKTPDQKVAWLKYFLLPFAKDTDEIDNLNQQILKAKLKPAELDLLVTEAAKRTILVDLLRTLQAHRGWDTHAETLKKIGDLKGVNLGNLRAMVDERFAGALANKTPAGLPRISYDKREDIAVLLATIANLQKPDGRTLLYPDGGKRAEVVLGAGAYARAVDRIAAAYDKRFETLRALTTAQREGESATVGGDNVFIAGFKDKHNKRIDSIVALAAQIKNRRHLLAQLDEELKQSTKMAQARKLDYEQIVQNVLKARRETIRLVNELRRLERDLFLSQSELAEAGRKNQDLERRIRQAETTLGATEAQ